VVALEEEIAGGDPRQEEVRASIQEAKEEERLLHGHAQELRSKAERAKHAFLENKSRGKLLKSLLRLKRSKKLTTFYGRLGDLGSIDARYDVAVSTACPSLNHMLVQDTATAQLCVRFLRKNNLGVVTFVVLDKQKRLPQPMRTPGNAPRLVDLIQPSQVKFLPAFYYACRDTLVADSLDTASRIAYAEQGRRFRVVTLAGQLIDISGAMSGGGKKVTRGAMRSTATTSAAAAAASASGAGGDAAAEEEEQEVTEEDVRALRDDLKLTEQQLQKVRARVASLEEELEEECASLARARTRLRSAQQEMQAVAERCRAGEQRVAAAEAQASSSSSGGSSLSAEERAHKQCLQKSVGEIGARLCEEEAEASTVQMEVDRLAEKVMAAGGMRLRIAQAQLESVRADLDTASSDRNRRQVRIRSTSAKLKRAEKSLEKLRAEASALTERHREMVVEQEEMNRRTNRARTNHEEAQSALQAAQEETAELRQQFEVCFCGNV
jgi:structural maintenance of chromosome 4